MCCRFQAGRLFAKILPLAILLFSFKVEGSGLYHIRYFHEADTVKPVIPERGDTLSNPVADYDAVAGSLYERLAEEPGGTAGEEAAEYVDEIVDTYRKFLRSPLDINKASRRELERAGFLGQYRIASLMDYRERFGDVLSLTELSNIPGFGKEYVEDVSAMLSLGNYVPAGYSSAYKGGWGHDLTLRVKYRAAGGEKQPFPIDRMLKYKAASVSGLSFGIAARSAPGDKFFPPGSFSAFISYEPKSRIVRKMILGDYNARFGQGGLMWSSFTMNSLSSGTAFMRTEPGITGYCTGGGGVRLRGAALELAAGDLSVSLLGSYRYDYVAGGRRSGTPFLAGANLSYWFSRFKVGVTGIWHGTDNGGVLEETACGVAADMRVQVSGISLYAEIAFEGNVGIWTGAEIPVGERWNCSVTGRFVPDDFSGKYSSPFSTDSGAENECALSVSFRRRSGMSPDLIVAADLAYFPETKNVGTGVDFQLKCRGEWRKDPWKTVGSLTFRGMYDVVSSMRGEWCAGVPKDVNATGFGVTVRADVSLYSGLSAQAPSFGCGRAVSAEGSYRLAGHFAPVLAVYARLALFHCDRWSERIYCYERDLYGSMSVPALYGRGMSSYLMAVYRPWRWLKLSFKTGVSWYYRLKSGTSGMPPEKEKRCIADLKFQCELSF